jgi:hypothetical protein
MLPSALPTSLESSTMAYTKRVCGRVRHRGQRGPWLRDAKKDVNRKRGNAAVH